jgi:hypothetical protein
LEIDRFEGFPLGGTSAARLIDPVGPTDRVPVSIKLVPRFFLPRSDLLSLT